MSRNATQRNATQPTPATPPTSVTVFALITNRRTGKIATEAEVRAWFRNGAESVDLPSGCWNLDIPIGWAAELVAHGEIRKSQGSLEIYAEMP